MLAELLNPNTVLVAFAPTAAILLNFHLLKRQRLRIQKNNERAVLATAKAADDAKHAAEVTAAEARRAAAIVAQAVEAARKAALEVAANAVVQSTAAAVTAHQTQEKVEEVRVSVNGKVTELHGVIEDRDRRIEMLEQVLERVTGNAAPPAPDEAKP